MRLARWGIASALTVLVTSACIAGSSAPPPEDDPAIDVPEGSACAVTDDPLAAQALHSAVKRDPPSGLAGLCSWHSLKVSGDALTVQIDDGGAEKYDFDHASLRVRDLPGVGDKAFAVLSPAGFVQIGMLRAGSYVTIVLMLQTGTDRLERATALAKAIAERMGG